jgi:hypothetical protein
MSITVHNCKTSRPVRTNPNHIYCGRPVAGLAGSPLGNPFTLPNDGDRDQVVQMFRADLWAALTNRPTLRLNPKPAVAELYRIAKLAKEGHSLSLFCWCTPQSCHCDIIKSSVEWLIRSGKV